MKINDEVLIKRADGRVLAGRVLALAGDNLLRQDGVAHVEPCGSDIIQEVSPRDCVTLAEAFTAWQITHAPAPAPEPAPKLAPVIL